MHKVTEHWATYTSKTRGCGTPVELLKQHVVTTGRKPRDLRVDNAKEFTSQEIVNFYQENNIILQPVVAYNHTMQARVEGAIGCSKHRSSLCQQAHPLLACTTLDFTCKRNTLWAKQ